MTLELFREIQYHDDMAIPSYKQLCNPILKVLHSHNGSIPVPALEQEVADIIGLSAAERREMRSDNKTRLSYRVAWARYYLKKEGILARGKRGICTLSEKGKKIHRVEI